MIKMPFSDLFTFTVHTYSVWENMNIHSLNLQKYHGNAIVF